VPGRAIRAEHRMHLAGRKARARAVARRAPSPGQKGSRRWRHYRRRQRLAEARHRRRVRQAQHEAAKTVIGWAVGRTCLVSPRDPRRRAHRRRARGSTGRHRPARASPTQMARQSLATWREACNSPT
jgi:hypothetical protein